MLQKNNATCCYERKESTMKKMKCTSNMQYEVYQMQFLALEVRFVTAVASLLAGFPPAYCIFNIMN